LSMVCGLANWQRALLIMERFDDLTENDKDKIFKTLLKQTLNI
jgi:hypothetical protein